MRPFARVAVAALLAAGGPPASADPWEEAAVDSSPSLQILSRIGGEEQPWSSARAISPLRGEAVRLRLEPVDGADEVRWFQIIPDVSRFYKNANHPWEADAYQWVGFGEIDYTVKELEHLRGQWSMDPVEAAASHEMRRYRSDAGSFWFQARVRNGGRILRSAGVEDNDSRNLTPAVFRMSIREGDGFLGHLTGFFNVPGVFGSIPYQCSNYIGVDCADVLVAADNKRKGRPNTKDYNVDMLVGRWPKIARATLVGGRPAEELKWGDDIRPGDAIAVRYPGARRYQHIGALHSDADDDGLLGPGDKVLHAGPEALHFSTLAQSGFDGDIAILRPPDD